MLSLTSIILGGQQAYALPHTIGTEDVGIYKEKLRSARRRVVFASQAPMMCLAYAIILFLAGLTVFVVSPFTKKKSWGDESKVRSFVIITTTLATGLIRMDPGNAPIPDRRRERYRCVSRYVTHCQWLFQLGSSRETGAHSIIRPSDSLAFYGSISSEETAS